RNYYSDLGVRLFMGIGILLFLLAFLPIDVDYQFRTFEGRADFVIGNLAFVVMPLCMIVIGIAFMKENDWGRFWAIGSFVLAFVGLLSSGMLKFFPVYEGMFERLGMG